MLGLVVSLVVQPSTAQTPKPAYIDTVSGADQQFLFNTFIIPEAKKDLKVDVEYVRAPRTPRPDRSFWAKSRRF